MAQILPSIGFRHSDGKATVTQSYTFTLLSDIILILSIPDYVQPLQKPVRARYCKGLFTQVPYRNGSVYNVSCCNNNCMI